MPQTPCFQFICPVPFPGRGRPPGQHQETEKPPKTKGEPGEKGGREKGSEIWETKLFSHSPYTGIKNPGSLCLPEETALAGPLFAGEEEISRFSRGAPVPAPAVRQGQGTASAGLGHAPGHRARQPGHLRGGWRGGTGLPLPPRLPRDTGAPGGRSRSWMGRGGEAEAGRVGAPGRAPCGTRPGAIWRLPGTRRAEPGAAAPPAAAAPARPPSAGPPPPAAGSC